MNEPFVSTERPVDLNDEVLNVAEAAAILDINSKTLKGWISDGVGPPVCVLNGMTRILKSSLLTWVKQHQVFQLGGEK